LTAMRSGRICWIDAGTLLRPGPRLLGALEELAACLHPDRARPER
jgi:ABC-type hemin transport system substrate-binding protein